MTFIENCLKKEEEEEKDDEKWFVGCFEYFRIFKPNPRPNKCKNILGFCQC